MTGLVTPGQNTDTGVPLDLSYDLRGRLQTVSTAEGVNIARYDYNASGWRLAKRRVLGNGQWEMTRFVYSGTNLAAERIVQGSGDTILHTEERRYLWLGLRPAAMLRLQCSDPSDIDTCGEWEYYDIVSNRIGAPVAVVKPGGTVVWQVRYTPYGIPYMLNEDVDEDGTALVFNLRLPGQYFDSETGFNYNGHRYYIPELRRYNRPEPIGQAGSLDLYMYAGGNPVMFIDPNGLEGKHYLILYGEGKDEEQTKLLYDLAKARQKQLKDKGDTATVREGTDEDGNIVPAPVKSKKDIEDQLEEESLGSLDGIIYYGHGTPGALTVAAAHDKPKVYVDSNDFKSIAQNYGDRLAPGAVIELHACNSGARTPGRRTSLAQDVADFFGFITKGYTRQMKFTPTKTEPYNKKGKNKGKFKKFKPDPKKKVKPKKREFYDPFRFNL